MKGFLSLFKKKPGNSESARMLEELSAICDKWLKDSKALVENKDMSLSPAVLEEVSALVRSRGDWKNCSLPMSRYPPSLKD